jgi:hypothetical protein
VSCLVVRFEWAESYLYRVRARDILDARFGVHLTARSCGRFKSGNDKLKLLLEQCDIRLHNS